MSKNIVFPEGSEGVSHSSSHLVTVEEANEMVAEGREKPGEIKHITFHRDAIDALLAQEGARGIRFYHAIHEEHHTLVGFAVDANGVDIQALAIERGQQCPPNC